MAVNMSAFKRNLLKSFDSMYLEVFNSGVKRLTIDVVGNKVIIVGEHSRLPGLATIDTSNRFVTRMTDVALLDECKIRLRKMLEEKIPEVKIRSILNDYDPSTEIAVTVIVAEDRFQEKFSE